MPGRPVSVRVETTSLTSQKRECSVVDLSRAQVCHREPSRAKVLWFSRTVFKDTATSDSELVSGFAASVQALLVAYIRSLNSTRQTNTPEGVPNETSHAVDT